MFAPDLLAGRHVLITGGGTGLGRAIGRRYLQLGASLVICGRRTAVLETAAEELRAELPCAAISTIGCDVRDPAQVEAMLDRIWQDRPLDVLVNNAAGHFRMPLPTSTAGASPWTAASASCPDLRRTTPPPCWVGRTTNGTRCGRPDEEDSPDEDKPVSDQLANSAQRLFATHGGKDVIRAAEAGCFPQALWDAVVGAGFAAALLPEDAGGFGATVHEAMRLVQIAAEHAAPIPLAETMLAGWLFAQAGIAVPAGVLTLAPVRRQHGLKLERGRLSGTASRIPWARDAAAIAVAVEGQIALLPGGRFTVQHDRNLAGEPRDTITVEGEAVLTAPCALGADQVRAAGAAIRTVQIAGALTRALNVSVQYAQTRVQFGRPIGKFQAIQHNLAILAGQSAAAIAAADMAAEALGRGLDPLAIGAAKARAGEAASIAAGLAHQSHGAIGFTQEYELHHSTRRLWSWRDEFGNEAEWNRIVGRAALQAGADGLWPALTAA